MAAQGQTSSALRSVVANALPVALGVALVLFGSLLDLDFCAVLDGGVVALEGSGSEIIARERSGHSYRGDSVSLTGNVSITCWAPP